MAWTLYEGDCREVLKQFPDNHFDAVVTDPPFKLSQEYSQNADADNLVAVSSIWPVSQELFRVAKQGALAAVFYDIRILPLALQAFTHAGWKYLRGLTFYRRWGNAHQLYGWMSTSDFILIFAKPGEKYNFYGTWAHDVYIKDKPESEGFNHPAQKPLDVVEHLVARITPENGIVLDCYAGSGTVGVAAEGTNRKSIMIEQDPKYCNIIRNRMSNRQTTIFEEGVTT